MPIGGTYGVQARWILLIMAFSCFFILSSQRTNMSMAIVTMVNWSAIRGNSSPHCPTLHEELTDSQNGEFVWGPFLISQILASYFYGLIPLHIPAELLVEKFSAHYIVLLGMALATICDCLTPKAATWHVYGLICLQITKAMGHAVVMPAISLMLGKWIPTRQLVRFMAYTTCGISTGAFFTILIGGVICGNPNYGWPYLFYGSGTMGIVWCLLWLYMCFDLHFIPILTTTRRLHVNYPKREYPVPLGKILLSRPFWGYVAAGIASYWILAYNFILLPVYFRMVFEMQIEWNGLVSSFPNVLQAFVYLLTFTISERVLAMGAIEKTAARRLFMCIGLSAFATSMVLQTFALCNRAVGVLLMVIGVGVSGFSFATLSLIPVDMSPNFSGIISGMMNTIGTIAGSALLAMIGYLTENETHMSNWIKIFYSSTFVSFICMILFMAYSSCEIQLWNDPDDTEGNLFGRTLQEEHHRAQMRPSTVMKRRPSQHREGTTTKSLTRVPSKKHSTKRNSTIVDSTDL